MKSIFEELGGTYRREGDYLIPDLELPETEHEQIGKYGHLRQTYLREHRPVLYNTMFRNGTIYRHLAEIDQICSERMEHMVAQMAEREGVTETLKAFCKLLIRGLPVVGLPLALGDLHMVKTRFKRHISGLRA